MFRLLIMCLLGLSGIFFKTSGTHASTSMEMMSMTNEAEGMAGKSKRHFHLGTPCLLSGHHETPAYQKPIAIPSYHQIPKVESISYQKPMVPKMVYQTIQRPAVHHAAYNVQPTVKQQVQYIQQPTYMPIVKEHPISYAKPAAAQTVSYEHVQKLFTNYMKPAVQHVQPMIRIIHPEKLYVNKIPCAKHPAPVVEKPIEKPAMDMQAYYAKQYFQPISYYQKPVSQPKPISIFTPHVQNEFQYPAATKVIYQKPNPINHPQPAIKVSSVSEPGCDKMHQPQISYVHQPMFQYAPKYDQPVVQQPMVNFVQKLHEPVVQQPLFHFTQKIHQPAIVQQPIVHLAPKIHEPIRQNVVLHHAQPIVYGNAQHSVPTVAPHVDYDGHDYQSPIIGGNQPCHK